MRHYYLLTKRDGVKVIEAMTVDEFSPFTVRFVTPSDSQSFERDDLLWWEPRTLSPMEMFSRLENLHAAHPGHSAGAAWPSQSHKAHSPWDHHGPPSPGGSQGAPSAWANHGAWTNHAHRKPDFSELSGAASDALTAAVLRVMPHGWKRLILKLKVAPQKPAGGHQVSYRIFNPDSGTEAIDFSDELFAAAEVYHRIQILGGYHSNQVTLSIHRDKKVFRTETKNGGGASAGPR